MPPAGGAGPEVDGGSGERASAAHEVQQGVERGKVSQHLVVELEKLGSPLLERV